MRSQTLLVSMLIAAVVIAVAILAWRDPRAAQFDVAPDLSAARRPADVLDAVELASEPGIVRPTGTSSDGAPASTRQATERRTTCELGGWVRWHGAERLPVESAYVGLLLPALDGDSDESPVWLWRGPREERPQMRQVQRGDRTNEEGRFVFDELHAGTYVLYVDYGPLVATMTAPIRLEPGEVRGGVEIVLPATGGLTGRILAPAEVSLEDWRVGMSRKEPGSVPPVVEDWISDDTIRTRIAYDGTFRIAPASAGLHHAWLIQGVSSRPISQAPKVLIGEVEIRVGSDVDRTFDLRDGFPGALRVTLMVPLFDRTESRPTVRKTPCLVVATPRFGGDDVEPVETRCPSGDTVVMGPLLPGAWGLSVRSNLSAWVYEVPASFHVQPGRSVDVTIEVPLYAGTLACVADESGVPLAQASLMIETAGKEFGLGAATDASGNLRLTFPPGTYTVARYARSGASFDIAAAETIEWREDGPHPPVVKLLRPVSAPR